jgi:hypothetical protein
LNADDSSPRGDGVAVRRTNSAAMVRNASPASMAPDVAHAHARLDSSCGLKEKHGLPSLQNFSSGGVEIRLNITERL